METIGRYRIVRVLGRGGMGVVYETFDPLMDRTVALKVILSLPHTTDEEYAQLKTRFLREAAAAGRLSHPNIVHMNNLGEADGLPYLDMEFVAGKPLNRMLLPGVPVSLETALAILEQIAAALDHAHAKGIVHRDIKPPNILMEPDGTVKLTDFGIAHISSQTITRTGVTMGTVPYMSPEQLLAKDIDGRTDQFSLAVMAYEMLAGQLPFVAPTDAALMLKIIGEEPKALHDVNARLPRTISAVVSRALSKVPEKRYRSCPEFVAELRTAAEGALYSPTEPEYVAPVPKPTAAEKAEPERQDRAAAEKAERERQWKAEAEQLARDKALHRERQARKEHVPPAPKPGRGPEITHRRQRWPVIAASAVSVVMAIAGWFVYHQNNGTGQAADTTAKTPRSAAGPAEQKGGTIPSAPQTSDLPHGQRAGQTITNPKDGLTYVWIPPGTFQMGCSPGDWCDNGEKPAHKVTLTKGFWMGQTPVTQAAYQRVIGSNPSHFHGEQLPVEQVNWNESQSYCQAGGMRLPTEAEWEYAARAGTTGSWYGDLDQIAWYYKNSGGLTHPVRQKLANKLGLYDMLGNVSEWVADFYADKYPDVPQTNPTGSASGQYHVVRGGSWYGDDNPRASLRGKIEPGDRFSFVGLRCAGN